MKMPTTGNIGHMNPMTPIKGLPHQDRAWFDAQAVLAFLERCPHGGEAPQQGWLSLAKEACHRIAFLEGSVAGLEAMVAKLERKQPE